MTPFVWVTEKPDFTDDCLLIAACFFGGEWQYDTFQIKNVEGYMGWYTGDGDEYGDLEDLNASKYMVLPLIK